MARYHNPKITTNKNLSLVLDAANPKSYTGVTTSVTTTIEDPYADNVSLLLNGNGTNGSTTFTDSSSYGHTVTPVGNAQISTTQSKFGGASMAFLGSGNDTATISDDAAFQYGTDDFTIEMWVYVTGFGNYFTPIIKWNGSGTNSGTRFGIYINSSVIGTDAGYVATLNYTTVQSITNSLNTWYHIAVVRSGTSFYIFRNGTLHRQAAISSSQSFTASGNVTVGGYPDGYATGRGYIDDLRITKGVARYTSNFTPPAVELYLSTTETQQAPVLTDISLNNNTATLYNGVGYTSSNVGYFTFDGTNDYMEIPYDESVNLTDGDFTIDFWMNSSSDQTSDVLVSYGNTSNVGGWAIKTATNKLQYSVGFSTHPAVAGIVTDGLVVHLDAGNSNSYPGSGTTWTDLSGNGNNGILVNGVGYSGDNLGSLSFDGTNDYVSIPNMSTYLTNKTQFSYSTFIKITGAGTYGMFFTFGNNNNFANDITFYYLPANSTLNFQVNNGSDGGGSMPYTIGQYDNICVVYDGNQSTNATKLKVYINGNLQTLTFNYNVPASTSGTAFTDCVIGVYSTADYSSNTLFAGNVGTAQLYNKALTESEIQRNYNALKGRYTSQPSPLDPLDTFGIAENADFSSGITTNTWNHYALVRSGNVYTPYVNAVPGTSSYVYGVDSNMDLYFDNASIILNANGDNGSTNIIDSSKNNHTGIITAYSGAGISTAEYKFGGSSLYFDGTDDYIDCGASDAYSFGTGDFMIEFWHYIVAGNQNWSTGGKIFSTINLINSPGISLSVYGNPSNFLQFYWQYSVGNSSTSFNLGIFAPINEWYHVAWGRKNGASLFFVNGEKKFEFTQTYTQADYTNNTLALGKDLQYISTYMGESYIDDFIITKGVAKYTSDFTPPNQASYYSNDPNYDNLSILLQGNGTNGSTDIIDSSPNNHTGIITAYSGAGISTAEYKFGGSSLYFDGTDDYINCGISSDYSFGNDPFTIEFWMRVNTSFFHTSQNTIFSTTRWYGQFNHLMYNGIALKATIGYYGNNPNGVPYVLFSLTAGTTSIGFLASDYVSRGAFFHDNWGHIAISCDGTNFKCFCNGVLASTINAYNQPYEGDHLIIGGNQIAGGNNPNVNDFINAYIDDFRITKGVAKYTEDFIPPDRTKIQNNRASLKFGASGIGNTNPFNGALSNLKIYKDSLTQSEITQNFNAHKSRYGL